MESGFRDPRSAPIYSANYDFQPMVRDYPRSFWVDLKFPPPPTLRVGYPVEIVSTDPRFVPPQQSFLVQDIVGTRVILSSTYNEPEVYWRDVKPYVAMRGRDRDGMWHPWQHDAGEEAVTPITYRKQVDPSFYQPEGWGYSTRGSVGVDRNWLYGRGRPVGYLVW